MININEKQKDSKCRERRKLTAKLCLQFQNMGTSYYGFGKTPKSKTCKKNLKRDLQQKSKIGIFCATVAEINTAG